MNKGGKFVLALFFFFLTLVCVAAVFMDNSSPAMSWGIGFAAALVVGVGAYFLFGWLQKKTNQQQEKIVQTILVPLLPAGETIQAFVQGFTGPGRTGTTLLVGALGDAIINSSRRKYYYIAITRQYVVMVQVNGKKPTGVNQVLRRGEILSMQFERPALKEPRLVLQFAAERMELLLDGGMIERAKQMAAAWNGTI